MPQQSDTRRHHQQSDLTQTRCSVPTSSSFSALGSPRLLLPLARVEHHLKEGEAAFDVNCPLINLLRGLSQDQDPARDYELVISDEGTEIELYSTRQGNLKENTDYTLKNNFVISLITESDRPLAQAAAPKVECRVNRVAALPPGQQNDEESP
ncbi:hypothetical protein Pcinc_017688 [Petrolisthes cinctipes]|uniref:Uncharacterized protein n=1 Tax=Petrolisthes cinctipes TaxID=88211 RepID=A0AAE1FQ85_PETCI|nr:hypothetical protein Pcinc_017688 [Petrolisthes cinctipes]